MCGWVGWIDGEGAVVTTGSFQSVVDVVWGVALSLLLSLLSLVFSRTKLVFKARSLAKETFAPAARPRRPSIGVAARFQSVLAVAALRHLSQSV